MSICRDGSQVTGFTVAERRNTTSVVTSTMAPLRHLSEKPVHEVKTSYRISADNAKNSSSRAEIGSKFGLIARLLEKSSFADVLAKNLRSHLAVVGTYVITEVLFVSPPRVVGVDPGFMTAAPGTGVVVGTTTKPVGDEDPGDDSLVMVAIVVGVAFFAVGAYSVFFFRRARQLETAGEEDRRSKKTMVEERADEIVVEERADELVVEERADEIVVGPDLAQGMVVAESCIVSEEKEEDVVARKVVAAVAFTAFAVPPPSFRPDSTVNSDEVPAPPPFGAGP